MHVVSDNELFRSAIKHLIKEMPRYTGVSCAPSLIISDGSTLLSTYFDYSYPICALIVFTENEGHENVMRLINYPFHVYYLSYRSSLEEIRSVILLAYYSITRKRECLAHIHTPPKQWLTRTEYRVIMDVFNGKTDACLSLKYPISYKSVQNYRKSSMNKLNFKFCYKSKRVLNYYFDLFGIVEKYQMVLQECVLRQQCPASLSYRSQPLSFYECIK